MREENLRPLVSFSVVGGGGDDATDKNRQITLKNWLITIHTFFSLCLEIRGEGGRRRRTRLTRLTRNYYTSCCCCYHTAAAAAPTAVSRVWRQDPHRPLPRSRSTSPFCCTKKRKLFSKFKQWLKKNNTFLICFLYSKIAWRIKRIGTFFGPRFEFFLCSMTLLQVSGGGGDRTPCRGSILTSWCSHCGWRRWPRPTFSCIVHDYKFSVQCEVKLRKTRPSSDPQYFLLRQITLVSKHFPDLNPPSCCRYKWAQNERKWF